MTGTIAITADHSPVMIKPAKQRTNSGGSTGYIGQEANEALWVNLSNI